MRGWDSGCRGVRVGVVACGMCVHMVCVSFCVYVVWCVCIGGMCICVFISRKQIHLIPLTFKSQQREDPASSSKQMSRGNEYCSKPALLQFRISPPVGHERAAQVSYLESVTVGSAVSHRHVPMSNCLGAETYSKDACTCHGPESEVTSVISSNLKTIK